MQAAGRAMGGCEDRGKPTHGPSLQKVDVTSKAVAEVLVRTIEYLQPNPGRSQQPAAWPLQEPWCHQGEE